VVSDDDAQRRDAGEAFLEVFAMSLDRSAEGPGIHAIGTDADRAAPAAGAERQNLVETIKQAGPLLGLDQPGELRTIRGKLRRGEPLVEILQRLLLEGLFDLD